MTPANESERRMRRRAEELIAGALYGELDAAEQAEWERLKSERPEFAQEYEELNAALTTIGGASAGTNYLQYPSIIFTNSTEQEQEMSRFFDHQWGALRAPQNENVLTGSAINPSEIFHRPTYGAVELKAFRQRATAQGFIVAMSLLVLLLVGYSAFRTLSERSAKRTIAVNKMKLSQLPPPPTAAQEVAPPPPPPSSTPGPAARAGNPVPVPDALVTPDMKDFANVEQVSRASTTGGDGNDAGFLGLAKEVATEIREDEPDAYEFIAVEKEPYIDIKELQKRVVYPEMAKRANIEGRVLIRVLVGKNGKPKKHIIESSDSELLNDEAVKAVMSSAFTPAIQNSQPVDCWVSIPIVFKIR